MRSQFTQNDELLRIFTKIVEEPDNGVRFSQLEFHRFQTRGRMIPVSANFLRSIPSVITLKSLVETATRCG